jgi:hypothetical protein
MNNKHDKIGRFSSKKAKIKFWGISIILIAITLAMAVVGAQEVYIQASQRVKDLFSPKVQTVTAETPEPTDMRDWVLWKVKEAGIDPYEAYSIINCESLWNPEQLQWKANDNGVDIGLWQINSYHQKQVKPSCSLDYKCATEEAIKIYQKRGNNWSAWNCAKIVGLK